MVTTGHQPIDVGEAADVAVFGPHLTDGDTDAASNSVDPIMQP